MSWFSFDGLFFSSDNAKKEDSFRLERAGRFSGEKTESWPVKLGDPLLQEREDIRDEGDVMVLLRRS